MRSTQHVLKFSLAVLFSGAVLVYAGIAPVGTLSGDDKVKLNGKSLTSSQLALPGDIVEAPGTATGTLHLGRNGVARLTAAARASVERSGQDVWVGLQSGFVSIGEGEQPMSVRAHGGKITASAGAVFDVAQVRNTTFITAVKGSAVVSDGGLPETQYVKEGQTIKVAFLEPGPLGYSPSSGSQNQTMCNDPCASNKDSKECKDFKALKKQCTPLRNACAKDSSKCTNYGQTCKSLQGCPGYAGIGEALSGTSGAAAASSSAAAASAGAAAAGTAAAGAGASVAATTAASAAAAAAGIAAGATAAASSGNGNTSIVSGSVP